jgi:RNA polymerase sigma-70 factor (ECF subfamily)
LLRHHFKVNESDIEDILQIAFIKAWKKIYLFRGESSFSTWLYVVIKNEALNFIKKKNIVNNHELSINLLSKDDEDNDVYDFLLSSSKEEMFYDSAEILLEKREILIQYKKILEDVILQLSPTHSQIIKMVLEDELSYKEVSEKLKIPIGTVMSRFHYARHAAQKLIIEQSKKEQVILPF